MQNIRPTLFRGRHFDDHVIVLCVRWYLRYCLTLRDMDDDGRTQNSSGPSAELSADLCYFRLDFSELILVADF